MRSVVKIAFVAATVSLGVTPATAQLESGEPPLAGSKAASAVAPRSSPIVDFGALIRGAGHRQYGGNGESRGPLLYPCEGCPCLGCPNTYSSLTIGPGQFNWQINDAGPSATFPTAPGVPGPTPDVNSQISGWIQLRSIASFDPFGNPTPGNLTWTATNTVGNQFNLSLETLLGPRSTVWQGIDGPMADFDPHLAYRWPIIAYQGAYSGPLLDASLTADTVIDSSLFANPFSGVFSIHLDQGLKQVDLLYTPTPVPEPGTLGLVGIGLLGVWRRSRRLGRFR